MIKIRSIYNLNNFRAFQKYTLKKLFVLAYCCGIVLIGIGILFAFFKKSAYTVYLLMGVLFPVVMHIYYKVLEWEALNKNIYLKKSAVQLFTFNEESIEVEQISNFDTFKDMYLYKDIIRIVKYKKYYFMYINRVQAFIVSNEDYVFGNEEELDLLFKTIKGKNFIVKSKKKAKEKNVETTK